MRTTRPILACVLVLAIAPAAWSGSTLSAIADGSAPDPAAADAAFEAFLAAADPRDADAFRTPAARHALVHLLDRAGDDRLRLPAARLLHRNPALAEALGLLVRPEDDAAAVCRTLIELHEAHGPMLDDYAPLAAALAVVHDGEFASRINENTAVADPPAALFAFFARPARELALDPRRTPPELLIHVVDAASPVSELRWAQNRYAGDNNVGGRFFDIDYDHAHTGGAPKALTQAGFSLGNILAFGGVCADQAYFAATVGKAIGVPTAYVRASGLDVGHAWVGFLRQRGRRADWDFDSGRYDEYQGLTGSLRCPQRREWTTDAALGVTASLANLSLEDRARAEALAHAARRLAALLDAGQSLPEPDADAETKPRAAPLDDHAESALLLVERSLRTSAATLDAWEVLARLGASGAMDLGQTKRWAGVVDRLGTPRSLDFRIGVLAELVAGVADPAECSRLLDRLTRMCGRRLDLRGRIRLEQGDLWRDAGDVRKAYRCYEASIDDLITVSRAVIQPLRRAEALLRDHGETDAVLPIYERTFSELTRPDWGGAFLRGSAWYAVGREYARVLREHGRTRDAERLERQLGP